MTTIQDAINKYDGSAALATELATDVLGVICADAGVPKDFALPFIERMVDTPELIAQMQLYPPRGLAALVKYALVVLLRHGFDVGGIQVGDSAVHLALQWDPAPVEGQ